MDVADPRGPQFCSQSLLIELRIVTRARDTAYVYDALDAVHPQNLEEIFPRAGGMPDRHNSTFRLYLGTHSVAGKILGANIILIHLGAHQSFLHGGHHCRGPGGVIDRHRHIRNKPREHRIVNVIGLSVPREF